MLIGIPKEIKDSESRVGLLPSSVRELTRANLKVIVQQGAGNNAGASDEKYRAAGAELVESGKDIYAQADMVVKVKEPQAHERKMLREGQILFSYLHLASDPDQTSDLIDSGAVCIAYETVLGRDGRSVPLLTPMSQIAGRLSIQVGARLLESIAGGPGILIGSVPGVSRAKVAVIGGGHVGSHAMEVAVGMGARVTVLDRDLEVLERLTDHFSSKIDAIYSTGSAIEEAVTDADLVIGAIHVRGQKTAHLVSKDMIKKMRSRSVVVDVAIDQGGSFETSRVTTHSQPTYVEEGVVHYCVANMPGVVPVSSTHALNNATLDYILRLGKFGYKEAMKQDPGLLEGLNVHVGAVTNRAVASEQKLDYVKASAAIN